MLVSGIGGMRAQNVVATWDFSQRQAQWGENGIAFDDDDDDDLQYRGLGDGQNGYQLKNGWIAIPVEAGQIVTFNLISIDNHQAYYQVTKETEGHSVLETIKFSGVKNTSTPRYVKADQKGWIKIVRDPDNAQGLYGGVRSIVLENAPNVSFSSTTCTANLIDLNINEPQLNCPAESSVSYRVENPNVAKLGGESGPGDLMAVNTGVTKVYADVIYKGQTYTAEYTLTIYADNAAYEVSGNTYTLTGPGKLLEPVVTTVPKMRMEFGAQDVVNTVIVRNENNGAQNVATILDENGWRQLWFTSEDKYIHPHQGSFYTFKPESSGTLTIKGYLNTENQTAYFVDSENLAPLPSNATSLVNIAYTSWGGSNVSYSTPNITTADGRSNVEMAEKYESTVETTGEILKQTITGLPAGSYTVELYANAMYTSGRGFTSDMADGATDVAYVFANNEQRAITAHIGGGVGENQVFSIPVTVGADGVLNLGLGKYKAGTNWHTIQIKSLTYNDAPSSSYQPVATISTSSASSMITTTVQVQGGKTYYLYGNVPSSNAVNSWATYQLKSFTFESNFHYPLKSIVLERGATSGGQQVVGNGNPTFRMELKGDITDASLNSDGTVSNIQGDGGAIVVYAKEGNDEIYYVITVPYTEKVWDFKANCYDEEKQGLDKTKEWAVNYEVRTYDEVTRNLIYLNNPVLTADEALEGNNAAFIGETAGLVVNATAKSFGLSADGVNYGDFAAFKAFFLENAENRAKYADYINTYGLNESMTEAQFEELKKDGAFVDVYLKLMLNFTKAEITENSTNVGAMQKGAVLTLPKMKAGEYVAIKWFRHGGDQGDNIKVTNLTDLDGTPISQNVLVINQNNLKGTVQPIIDCPYGWLEFKVTQDGDVTFEVDDKGWTHIKAIAISPEFIDTDLRLVVGVETAPATYTHDGSGVEIHFNATDQSSCQPQRQEAFYKVMFSYEDASPTLTDINIQNQVERGATYTGEPEKNGKGQTNVFKDAIFTAKGHGTVVIVQKAVTDADHGNYVIDIEKTRITIIEGGDTHQDYPYTWDFTNISEETKNKLTPANGWAQNSDGSYTPNETGKQNYVQNTELENGAGDDVAEYDGLGFLTSTSDGYSPGISNISIAPEGDDAGLKIGNSETTTVVVPDVPEGCTVFVRVEPNNENSVISSNGEPLVPTNSNVDGTGENLYEIPVERDPESDGSNKTDVLLELKDVTVKGIAVTNIYKEMRMASATNAGYYYNTDCQPKDIDYSLTQYYTNITIKADYITSDALSTAQINKDESGTLTATTAKDAVPANTGVIVYTTNGKNNTLYPLFVPGVNGKTETINDNLLTGVIFTSGASSKDKLYKYSADKDSQEEVEVVFYKGAIKKAEDDGKAGYRRYFFTNKYTTTSEPGVSKKSDDPMFFQTAGGNLKSNRAYLDVPTSIFGSANVKSIRIIGLFDNTDDATAIELINEPTASDIDLNGEFYSISGER